jgi:hypothetical protein
LRLRQDGRPPMPTTTCSRRCSRPDRGPRRSSGPRRGKG